MTTTTTRCFLFVAGNATYNSVSVGRLVGPSHFVFSMRTAITAPAQLNTAPAQLITAPAQLITAPAQPPATRVAVYTALFQFIALGY